VAVVQNERTAMRRPSDRAVARRESRSARAAGFEGNQEATLAGFVYVSQLAVKQMLKQKSGSIVSVSTTLVDQPVAGVGVAVLREGRVACGGVGGDQNSDA